MALREGGNLSGERIRHVIQKTLERKET